ncbi:hypothetical protein G039_0319815 [Pseudomonas aeruginosa VRFPA01]|nr:hypothetical protein G039_0319815 [Pseudomonas aeruginosa VRFPA01]
MLPSSTYSSPSRRAALAGGAAAGADQVAEDLGLVRVGEDHHVVLRPGEGLHPLQVRSAGAVHVLADGDRADEGNRPDVRVGEQGIDLFAAAMDHLQHALRRAGLEEQFGEAVGRQRILLGGLEDEGVAAGDGQREHP